jgi:hypothetical protein
MVLFFALNYFSSNFAPQKLKGRFSSSAGRASRLAGGSCLQEFFEILIQ